MTGDRSAPFLAAAIAGILIAMSSCAFGHSSAGKSSTQVFSAAGSVSTNANLKSSGLNQDASSGEVVAAASAAELAPGETLESVASSTSSTRGRVALAIIINRLDSTQTVADLAGKPASELFGIIKTTAPQKSKTLEGRDQLYGLRDILASEGIYVSFQSNDVESAGDSSPSKDWEQKFEDAVRSAQG